MNFIDTHTHLYDDAFGGVGGSDAAVGRAIAAGVTKMVIPDTCIRDRAPLFALCRRWQENCFPCTGLHPTEVGDNWQAELDAVSAALSSERGIVAIGETGIDLHWGKDYAREQETVFRTQLDFALERSLPVIVHARDAWNEIFRVLEDYRHRGLRGVMHAFSGSVETFRRLGRLGDWYVGIGGVLTFKNASIAATVKEIPIERILLETDSPYLTPVPHRGERNESAYIPVIASFLAGVTGKDLSEIAESTSKNARNLFFL